MDKEILEILNGFKKEFKMLNTKIDGLETKIDNVAGRQDETYQIVKGLEHSSEVSKAEHDKMSNDIAHITGSVEALRKDISNVEVITASNWSDIAKLKAVK